MANSTVKGIAEVTARLMKMGADIQQFVKDETEAVGKQITLDAIFNAADIQGAPQELKQQISYELFANGYGTRVTQNFLPLGAYFEFGTGSFVRVDPEWKDMAWSFYKNGKGTLRPHPYLYPAFVLNREKYLAILRKKLYQVTK